MVRYIAEQEGGPRKMKSTKLALVYHDSAYGKEPIPVLTELAKKYGYELTTLAVPHPGNEQQSQWLRVRQLRPGTPPCSRSRSARFPSERIVGVWWSGAEEHVPAGDAAKGYVAAGFNGAGTKYPLIEEIRRHVYAKGGGEMNDKGRIGSVYYNRGVVFGIITAEAVRVAQERFGKAKPVTGEQVQWALEHLNIDEQRLEKLGAAGFMPPLRTSCADHEGAGLVRFQRWDGNRWRIATDWMAPMPEDRNLVRQKYVASAQQYAKEKGVTPRQCPD